MRAVNTNLGVLGLDLHSNSPEPVNFFGAQSSLGRGRIFVWGSTAPRGAGLEEIQIRSNEYFQCRRYGGPGGAVPTLMTTCAPHFWFTLNTSLEHHATARQLAITEKGIITFKLNSCLKFSRFFAKLLATKWHKCDAIIVLLTRLYRCVAE